MAQLLLGPVLRAVSGDRASVWVETDAPCEVTVGSHKERTVTLLGTLELGPAGATARFEGTRVHGALGSRLEPVVEYALS